MDQPGAEDDSDTEDLTNEAPRSIELGELPPGVQPINAVDMTLDGARVAAGRANLVQVYDVDSGLEIVSLGGHKDLIQSVRYSPDGRCWRLEATRSQQSGRPRWGVSRRVCRDMRGRSGRWQWHLMVRPRIQGARIRRSGSGTWPRASCCGRWRTGVRDGVAIVSGDGSLVSGGGDGMVRWLDPLTAASDAC